MLFNYISISEKENFLNPIFIKQFEYYLHKTYNFRIFSNDENLNRNMIDCKLKNDFTNLIRLVREYTKKEVDVSIEEFTWYLLCDTVAIYFSSEWEHNYGTYFINAEKVLDKNIDIYFSITDLDYIYAENISRFTYYLMKNNILEDEDFIKNYNLLSKIVEKRINILEFHRFKEQLTAPVSIRKYYTIADTDLMTGRGFEEFLGNLLRRMGYDVQVTKVSGDQGIDIIANKLGEKVGVQAKCYSGKVGNKAIQEVVAGLKYYDCTRGLVITNSYFTPAAIELAQVNNILLWNRDSLNQKINRYINCR